MNLDELIRGGEGILGRSTVCAKVWRWGKNTACSGGSVETDLVPTTSVSSSVKREGSNLERDVVEMRQ